MRWFIVCGLLCVLVTGAYANCDGQILHVMDGKICMSLSDDVVRPALCMELYGKKYCTSLFIGNRGRVHVVLNGDSYSVPDFMTPAESVQFDGGSYINLGFVASVDLNFEICAYLDTSVKYRDGALFGGRRSMSDQYVVWYNTLNGNGLVAPRFFVGEEINSRNVPDGAVTIRWENNVFTINGVVQEIEYFTTPINQGSVNLTLGGLAIGRDVDSRRFLGTIYYAKFWDSNGLIMDLVAATDADGIGGMYDNVSGRMMYMMH